MCAHESQPLTELFTLVIGATLSIFLALWRAAGISKMQYYSKT